MKSYKILNFNSKQPIFISCEHASKVIPKKYGTIGIKRKNLLNIPDYYDVGAEELTRIIAKKLNAKCIIPNYSRMVINLNKHLNHQKLISDVCFGIEIPGNKDLTNSERNNRIKKYYLPYHDRIKREIQELKKNHKKVYYISIHSFFHKLNRVKRIIDVGILYKYKKDIRFCKKIKKLLTEKTDFNIKYNQPYSSFKTAGYTINKYGESKDISCVEFEINDKHLKDTKSIKKMGNILSSILKKIIS